MTQPRAVDGVLPQVLGECRWGVLVFDAPHCAPCDEQWQSVSRFRKSKLGMSENLIFFEVLPESEQSTPKGRLDAAVVVIDRGGHLGEQLAVLSRPSSALLDAKGQVHAWRSGLVAYDSPGFERLSVLLGSEKRPDEMPLVPLLLAALLLALLSALVFNLARRRASMLYRDKSNN